jgi:hypothetical protein
MKRHYDIAQENNNFNILDYYYVKFQFKADCD